MIKGLLRGIVSTVAANLLANYRHLSIRLLKIEAARAYLKGVRLVRLSVIRMAGLMLLAGLVILGALLFHVGLFVLLPGTMKAKALLAMILGLAYVAGGVCVFRAAMNERRWMEGAGATRMLDEAICPSDRRL